MPSFLSFPQSRQGMQYRHPWKVLWQTHLQCNEGLYSISTIQAVQTIHSKSTCLQTLVTKHKRREGKKKVYFKKTNNHKLIEQDHHMFSLNITTTILMVQAHCARCIPLTGLRLQCSISKSMHWSFCRFQTMKIQLNQIIYSVPRLYFVSKLYLSGHLCSWSKHKGKVFPEQVMPVCAGTEGQGHSPWTYILALGEDSKAFPVQLQLRPQQIFQFLSLPTFGKLVVVKIYHGSICRMGRGP